MKSRRTASGDRDDRPAGPVLAAVAHDASFVFENFRLDGAKRRLYRDERLVALPANAIETLLLLIEHRGHLVEKDELMRRVWPRTYVGDDSVAQCISVLRHALGDNAANPEFIVTVPRQGYRFIATVTEATAEAAVPSASPSTTAGQHSRWVMWPIVVVAVVIGAALGNGVFVRGSASHGTPLRFREYLPDGVVLSGGGGVSPDGQRLVYVARDASGQARLWVRKLDGTNARELAGTTNAVLPFWSPDGSAIGFFADRWVKTIHLSTGVVQPLAKVLLVPTGGSWSREGLILYGTRTSALNVIPVDGGSARPVTVLNQGAQEYGHTRPQFLPDGRHFLYTVVSTNAARRGLYLGSLDSLETRRVLEGSYAAVTYSPTGHLLFVKNRIVMAQRFDETSFAPTGTPAQLTEALPWDPREITISASDRLLAISGGAPSHQLQWLDRAGHALGAVETSAPLHTPAFSPDGSQLVASSDDPDLAGVWLLDLRRGSSSRITDGIVPYWSPAGDRIVYSSTRRAGVLDIYLSSGASNTPDTLLVENNLSKGVTDWSARGQMVFSMANPQGNIDIWLLDPQTKHATPWVQTPANEMQGRISPDGRWLAYTSDETGRWQVYLQSFPQPGMKRAVSILGGAQPAWRADGKELFYLTPEGVITSVTVSGDAQLASPKPLFRAPVSSDLVKWRNTYAPTGDGQRFLVDAVDDAGRVLDTIVDWQNR